MMQPTPDLIAATVSAPQAPFTRSRGGRAWIGVVRCVVGLGLALSATAAAAVPATKPSDTVDIAVDRVGATFRVPKTWQRRELKGGAADLLFVFDPAPKKKPGSPTFLQQISFYFDKPKADQTTLDSVVNDVRDALTAKQPDIKFQRDKAVTYAGQPAWMFQWTHRTKLIAQGPDGPKTAGFMDTDRVETVWLQNGTICQVGLHADTRFMPSLMQKAEPVAKTLTWTK